MLSFPLIIPPSLLIPNILTHCSVEKRQSCLWLWCWLPASATRMPQSLLPCREPCSSAEQSRLVSGGSGPVRMFVWLLLMQSTRLLTFFIRLHDIFSALHAFYLWPICLGLLILALYQEKWSHECTFAQLHRRIVLPTLHAGYYEIVRLTGSLLRLLFTIVLKAMCMPKKILIDNYTLPSSSRCPPLCAPQRLLLLASLGWPFLHLSEDCPISYQGQGEKAASRYVSARSLHFCCALKLSVSLQQKEVSAVWKSFAAGRTTRENRMEMKCLWCAAVAHSPSKRAVTR